MALSTMGKSWADLELMDRDRERGKKLEYSIAVEPELNSKESKVAIEVVAGKMVQNTEGNCFIYLNRN